MAKKRKKPAETVGGSGGPCVRPAGRADTRLLERALRERWPIPEKYHLPIIERQIRIAIDPAASPREATSAARCIVSMESQNIEVALKSVDKVLPDKLELGVGAEIRKALDELGQRARIVTAGEGDGEPGPVGGHGQSGRLASGATLIPHQPSRNGNGKPPHAGANPAD